MRFLFGVRVLIIPMLVGAILALTGCGCSDRRTGAEQKLAELLHTLGARVLVSNDLPALTGRCVIRWDDRGFEARVYHATYAQVEEWFVRMVGQPGGRFKTVRGKPGCLFRATDIGVGIVMAEMDDHVRVNCVRPITNWWQFGPP